MANSSIFVRFIGRLTSRLDDQIVVNILFSIPISAFLRCSPKTLNYFLSSYLVVEKAKKFNFLWCGVEPFFFL